MPDHFTDEEVEALKAGLENLIEQRIDLLARIGLDPSRLSTISDTAGWINKAADAIRRLLARLEQAEARVRAYAENEGEPVAWQYRILAGAEWTSWLPLDKPEWFLTNYAFNIANGTAERRPLYAHPDPAVERLQRELEEARASLVKAREALTKALELAELAEELTGNQADDEFVWSLQALFKQTLADLKAGDQP